MGETPELRLDGLRKSYGTVLAIDRCSLELRKGEIVALLGPSGCGKSTLLNMIAGFETPDFGTIALRGRDLTSVPPHRRNVAMVFQHYAMFPHMTVGENIAYGLKARRLDKEEIAKRVAEMVALLHLGGLEARYPAQLSGGQRQRVAVARALAVRPDMLLLDEAFSALDRTLREDMQLELSLLLRRLGVTTILVTHDQREAFALADRIAIMEKGRIAQEGSPEAVYRDPQSSYVLRFLGTTNRFEGNIAGAQDAPFLAVAPGFEIPLASDKPAGTEIGIDVRAEDIHLSVEPTTIHRAAPGRVALRTFLGSQERLVVDLGGREIIVDRPVQGRFAGIPLGEGDAVFLDFDPTLGRLATGR